LWRRLSCPAYAPVRCRFIGSCRPSLLLTDILHLLVFNQTLVLLGELVAFCLGIGGILVSDHHCFGFRQSGVAPTNLHVLHTANALNSAIVFYPQDKMSR